MNTYWQTWKGKLPWDIKQPKKYPLSFNLPPVSWNTHGFIQLDYRNLDKSRYYLGVDLVIELKSGQKAYTSNKKIDYCYHFAVGIYDTSHIDQIHSPGVRDIGVCRYYARWGENNNTISPVLPEDFANYVYTIDLGKEYSFEINQENFWNPHKILTFFNSFNTLIRGDFISLGSIFCTIIPPLSNPVKQVRICNEHYDCNIQIK